MGRKLTGGPPQPKGKAAGNSCRREGKESGLREKNKKELFRLAE